MTLEQLRPEEMDAHVRGGTFRLSFIGMSNAGKSYRSKTLHRELGFVWHHIDEMIYKELGFVDMGAISSWLGYPYAEGYAEREQTYLELENTFTKRSALAVESGNLVFDTTGSVVHLRQDTLEALHEHSLMVHLDVGDDSLAAMMEKFFAEPKPVAWCGFFSMEAGEQPQDALKRCYPLLLQERLARYRTLAHLNIPAAEMRDKNAEETLAIIRDYLTR